MKIIDVCMLCYFVRVRSPFQVFSEYKMKLIAICSLKLLSINSTWREQIFLKRYFQHPHSVPLDIPDEARRTCNNKTAFKLLWFCSKEIEIPTVLCPFTLHPLQHYFFPNIISIYICICICIIIFFSIDQRADAIERNRHANISIRRNI